MNEQTGKNLHDLVKLGLSKMFDERFDEHCRLALPNKWRGRSNHRFCTGYSLFEVSKVYSRQRLELQDRFRE